MNFKLAIIFFVFIAFLSLGYFVLAQNVNPTIEVCQSSDCDPEIAPTIPTAIVTKEEGIIPGDLTYQRGSVVRIHVEAVDPGGINYVKAIIKNSANEEIAVIPLFDDGKSSHGDEAGLSNGSPTGAGDNVYSNYWAIPFKFPTGDSNPYYLHIEAVDNFAQDILDNLHVYTSAIDKASPGYEIQFFLTDSCLATCGTIGNYRCSNGVRQQCVFDTNNDCNVWQDDTACSSGFCCGPSDTPNQGDIICCPNGSNNCDLAGACQTCDNTCSGAACQTGCPPALDPDCDPLGCCGDGTCDGSNGENPGNCLAPLGDCVDNIPPIINITTDFSSITETSLFQIEAKITDDWSPIASNPQAVISRGGITYRTVPLLIFDINNFRSPVIYATDNIAMTPGDYTVTVNASDIAGNGAVVSVNFTVSCASVCTVPGETSCSGNTKETCVINNLDGCYDFSPTDCTVYNDPLVNPDGVGFCKNNDCCEQNCDPINSPSVCDTDGVHINICELQGSGCYNQISGADCTDIDHLNDPNAVCRTGSAGDNCCIDECVISDPLSCNIAHTVVNKCQVDLATGCNTLIQQENCSLSGKICYDGNGVDSYCNIVDTTPPIVTLLSQPTTNNDWTENTNTTFSSGGASYINVNSLSDNIVLDVLTSANIFSKTDNWDINAIWDTNLIDVFANSGGSIQLRQISGFYDYPVSGEYTNYIDGGLIGPYEWNIFNWQGIFPIGFNTKMRILAQSSFSSTTPSFTTACDSGEVTVNGSMSLANCTNNTDRYLHFRVILISD